MISKSFKYTFFLATFLLVSSSLFSQNTKPVTLDLWVAGTCDMCEERIEKVLDVKGILFADYTLKEHKLEVVFKPHKISEDEIHALLNSVGHDTKKSKASDAQYNAIHECCRYRDHDCSKDH